ncbi:MAG: ISKra4 family transposase [Alphaproteobacteria bacterium]
MKWRVMVEVTGEDGAVTQRVTSEGERSAVGQAATLGLSLAESKVILAGIQHVLVTAQADAHCRHRRRCSHCGAARPLKDHRSRRLVSLFGTVEVRAPRFGPCRCGVACRRSLTPVAEIMPDRCTPEYECVLAGLGSALPYRRARMLLAELLPLDTVPEVETVRRRTLQVGARLERAALVPPDEGLPFPAQAITLAIDAGHVKSVRTYKMRSFEVMIARVGNDQGLEVVFSSMPAEADRQARQLHHVLRVLGATATTPVTILSDGAEGPRSLGAAASGSPIRNVLDWFHLPMRVQHVAQAVKGWATAEPAAAERITILDDAVAHVRWRLWHGQTERALSLIGDLLADLDANLETVNSPPVRKTITLLRALETYVVGQGELIIDYAAARHRGEPISTATTESTVQRLLHRRMGANQQMRWSPRGAHRMLKVRTAAMNGTLASDHTAAEPYARRSFRRAA